MNFWIPIAIISLIFAIGNIFFGHFEEKTPKWRKLVKQIIFNFIAIFLYKYFGILGIWGLVGVALIFALIIHAWWLPKKGINGWTAEPKDKYYELRGWKKK